jgi:hypothetical protein
MRNRFLFFDFLPMKTLICGTILRRWNGTDAPYGDARQAQCISIREEQAQRVAEQLLAQRREALAGAATVIFQQPAKRQNRSRLLIAVVISGRQ